MASDLDVLKQRAAVLSRRVAEARVFGAVPESWVADLEVLRTRIEVAERVLAEAEAGYRPVAALARP